MMKLHKFGKGLIIGWALLGLSACGGGGGSSSTDVTDASDSPNESVQPMILNQSYNVSAGQSIQKTSENAQVDLLVDFDSGETSVTLVSGSANLITP